ALGHTSGMPRRPDRVRVVDPAPPGRRGGFLLFRRPFRGPRWGRALRRCRGAAGTSRGRLFLRDLSQRVRARRRRIGRDRRDRPRRRPYGREVRPPRGRGARRHHQGYATRAARRRDAHPPHRRALRRPLRLPQAGDAL
ncbi:MAG: hypothetical protein AVDCRST_MAG03-3986, partial [uncultured Rubrobacteraceae bacterium]